MNSLPTTCEGQIAAEVKPKKLSRRMCSLPVNLPKLDLAEPDAIEESCIEVVANLGELPEEPFPLPRIYDFESLPPPPKPLITIDIIPSAIASVAETTSESSSYESEEEEEAPVAPPSNPNKIEQNLNKIVAPQIAITPPQGTRTIPSPSSPPMSPSFLAPALRKSRKSLPPKIPPGMNAKDELTLEFLRKISPGAVPVSVLQEELAKILALGCTTVSDVYWLSLEDLEATVRTGLARALYAHLHPEPRKPRRPKRIIKPVAARRGSEPSPIRGTPSVKPKFATLKDPLPRCKVEFVS